MDQGLTKPTKPNILVDSAKKLVQTFLEAVPVVETQFEVLRKIGEGAFSKVYQARKKHSKELYALKHLVHTTSHPTRIAAELRFMFKLGNIKNVIGVTTGLVCNGSVVIAMPYFSHNKFYEYVSNLTLAEIQHYMRNLLEALDWIHSSHVIHRDLKPSNFLFDRKLQRYALVDFGLAQSIDLGKETTQNNELNSELGKKTGKRLNIDVENNSANKRPCHNNVSQKPEASRILQPLKNRINFTVHPAGSDSIKKPDAPLHKQILGTAKKSVMKPPLNKHKLGLSALKNKTQLKPPPKLSEPKKLPKKCACYGKNKVCKICFSRKLEIAPRAGTPGFRAPEVLMRYKPQTTAVDLWSAGVIYLSLLCRRFPFFTASEDATALAEIIAIFGTSRMKNVAAKLNKCISMGCDITPKDLGVLCVSFRSSMFIKTSIDQSDPCIPGSAISLLQSMLEPDYTKRISASDALKHSFFSIKF